MALMLFFVVAGSSSCAAYEAPCGNGVCIPQSWFCDGVGDCSDRSDEDNSTCSMHTFLFLLSKDENNTLFDCIEAPLSP